MHSDEISDRLDCSRSRAFSIAMEEMQQQHVEENVSYWTVPKELFNFLSAVVSKPLYDRWDHLVGVEGNGLRRWQTLFEDCEGDLLTDISGRDRFMTFLKHRKGTLGQA